MAKGLISTNSRIVVSQDQVSCDLSGEAAILNLKSAIYFGLNTVGASIWKLIQEPRSVKEIQAAIQEEYEVEHDQCGRDVLELLQELSNYELIKIIDEKNT
jgi:Coenzyme PQQ synthesis protein D (PqqD)